MNECYVTLKTGNCTENSALQKEKKYMLKYIEIENNIFK